MSEREKIIADMGIKVGDFVATKNGLIIEVEMFPRNRWISGNDENNKWHRINPCDVINVIKK